jgi:hypothetical protein
MGVCEKKEDKTPNWKTYRNEEYGFEIRYPRDWRATINDFRGEPNMMFCPPEFFSEKNDGWLDSNGCPWKRRIWPANGPETIIIEGVGEVPWEVYKAEWEEKINKPFFQIYLFRFTTYTPPTEDEAYLGQGPFNYHWYLSGKNEKFIRIFNQMLSTFRFIEVEEMECEKWRKECAKEGEIRCGPCGCRNCCSGLVSRDVTHPYRTENNGVICLENMTAYICVKCGDGICGKGEDWCICPEDCPKPNPEDLERLSTFRFLE